MDSDKISHADHNTDSFNFDVQTDCHSVQNVYESLELSKKVQMVLSILKLDWWLLFKIQMSGKMQLLHNHILNDSILYLFAGTYCRNF